MKTVFKDISRTQVGGDLRFSLDAWIEKELALAHERKIQKEFERRAFADDQG